MQAAFRGRPGARRVASLLIPILAMASLSGCAGRRAAVEPVSDAGGPLRGTCKGRLVLEGRTHRFEAAFALTPPDRLRAEIGGRVGGTRAILTLNRGTVLILIPSEREYLLEEATPDIIATLIGIRIDPAHLLEVIAAAGTQRAFHVGGTGPGAGRISVRAEGDRVLILPDPPVANAFEEMELRFRDLDRSGRPPDGVLYVMDPPAGWERVRVEARGVEGAPLLLP